MIIFLIAGQIKKISLHKISHYLETYDHNKNKIKVELHLSNYATKLQVKKETPVDASEGLMKQINQLLIN